MKQILQNPRTGILEVADVPAPSVARGHLLVRNAFSAVSPGTEKLAVEFAQKSLLQKARSRPDLVRQVTRKLRDEGPLATYRAVISRLEAPQPLGYSSAGVVEEVGEGVSFFRPGDRVACAGAGYACHAEIITVPENLAAKVPDSLPLDQAAFATIGTIALQAIRVASPTLGEIGVVIGLGPIGQLAIQLLRANGCRVLAIDLDDERVKQASSQGAEWAAKPEEDLSSWTRYATGGYGADFAVITASADSSSPLELGANLCRLKGRIAVVGAFPISIDRRLLYEKELEIRMSTSYGPGRYDRSYEEQGFDYPLPWVRWTETRNLEAFLALAARGDLRLDLLDVEIVPFQDAVQVYKQLANRQRHALAAVFRYSESPDRKRTLFLKQQTRALTPRSRPTESSIGVAFLGGGTYARSALLPILARRKDVRLTSLVTATGASARATARKFAFDRCSTDPEMALSDPQVDVVFIATRHDSHADLAERALRANKAVWLEKPVGLSPEEVRRVIHIAAEKGGFLFVGYNRRFSPHARAIRSALTRYTGPFAIRYTVSAGPPPRNSWITDPEIGGGRIIGEVCHFVDLCSFFVGTQPERVFTHRMGDNPDNDDSVVSILSYPDRSVAIIEYLASASHKLPKERIEISRGGHTSHCLNFRKTQLPSGRRYSTRSQDKGQHNQIDLLFQLLRSQGQLPWTSLDLLRTSEITFEMAAAARAD